jgi:hypothetical protein
LPVVFLSFDILSSACISMYLFVVISIGTNRVYFILQFCFQIGVLTLLNCVCRCVICPQVNRMLTQRKFCVRFGIFNPAIVYDHLGEIYSALVFGSFVFCIFLYIKVSYVKKQFCFLVSLATLFHLINIFFSFLGSCSSIFIWLWILRECDNWLLLGKYY